MSKKFCAIFVATFALLAFTMPVCAEQNPSTINSTDDVAHAIIGKDFCYKESSLGMTDIAKWSFTEKEFQISFRDMTETDFSNHDNQPAPWKVVEDRYTDTGGKYFKVIIGDLPHMYMIVDEGPTSGTHIIKYGGDTFIAHVCTNEDLQRAP